MAKDSHISRREYRKKYLNRKKEPVKPTISDSNYERNSAPIENTRTRINGHVSHPPVKKLNIWEIFSDRPYVAVAIIVLAIFFIMAQLWWLLGALVILVIIGIFVIGHSHHPNRVLSLEFKMKASRKLSMLRAIQFGGSIVMFLATYMKQVVTINFPSTGTTDSFQVIQGALSGRGGVYGQQGSYFLGLLNTLTGGQLWGSYRYATNSAQMMSSSSGRMIIMWILLLMIAPAFCVISQFFREPYSRNFTLLASIVSTVSFILTPHLMRKWIVGYAMENQISQQAAEQAVVVGKMAYIAIACAIIVLVVSIYRVIKRDNFK
ncbi:MAG TPA: cytochrome C5 [Lactobacillus acetotolerans]|nr:cytochrome C5 [Lactobacillus acetotolerans]